MTVAWHPAVPMHRTRRYTNDVVGRGDIESSLRMFSNQEQGSQEGATATTTAVSLKGSARVCTAPHRRSIAMSNTACGTEFLPRAHGHTRGSEIKQSQRSADRETARTPVPVDLRPTMRGWTGLIQKAWIFCVLSKRHLRHLCFPCVSAITPWFGDASPQRRKF